MFFEQETELKNMAENEFLEYKGRPIVRNGNVVYYGSSSEKFIIKMTVLSEKKAGDKNIADRITVQLLSTDTTLEPQARVVKTREKNGFYNALDIGVIWLERALKK